MLPTYLLKRAGSVSWIGQPWIDGLAVAANSFNPNDPKEAAVSDALATFSHFTYQASNHMSVYVDFQGGS
jgi:hypothetical protein